MILPGRYMEALPPSTIARIHDRPALSGEVQDIGHAGHFAVSRVDHSPIGKLENKGVGLKWVIGRAHPGPGEGGRVKDFRDSGIGIVRGLPAGGDQDRTVRERGGGRIPAFVGHTRNGRPSVVGWIKNLGIGNPDRAAAASKPAYHQHPAVREEGVAGTEEVKAERGTLVKVPLT